MECPVLLSLLLSSQCNHYSDFHHHWLDWPILIPENHFKWAHVICTLLCLASSPQQNIYEIFNVAVLVFSLLKILSIIHRMNKSTICLFIHLSMEIWIVSSFWCCGIELLWISLSISFSGQRHSFLLEIYVRLELCIYQVGVGIAFYLVCSILQPRSRVVNRVSESRGLKRLVWAG